MIRCDPNDARWVSFVDENDQPCRLLAQEGRVRVIEYTGEPGAGYLTEAGWPRLDEDMFPGPCLVRFGPGQLYATAAVALAMLHREDPALFAPLVEVPGDPANDRDDAGLLADCRAGAVWYRE